LAKKKSISLGGGHVAQPVAAQPPAPPKKVSIRGVGFRIGDDVTIKPSLLGCRNNGDIDAVIARGERRERLAEDERAERAAARAPLARAGAALARLKGFGYREAALPTPERLLQAGGAADVQKIRTKEQISQGSEFKTVDAEMARVRVTDDPFARLCRNKQLDSKDPTRHLAFCMAGIRFRQNWRDCGLGAVRAADPTREALGGSGIGLLGTEAASNAFGIYRAALEAVPVDYRPPLEAIVLHDREPADVGREVSAYRGEKQAEAVALHDLRRALVALANFWGLLPPPEASSAASGPEI
jgi:hypothetical protein